MRDHLERGVKAILLLCWCSEIHIFKFNLWCMLLCYPIQIGRRSEPLLRPSHLLLVSPIRRRWLISLGSREELRAWLPHYRVHLNPAFLQYVILSLHLIDVAASLELTDRCSRSVDCQWCCHDLARLRVAIIGCHVFNIVQLIQVNMLTHTACTS